MRKLTVHPEVRIGDIQNEFNQQYPYLRLEFFKGQGKPSAESEQIAPSVTLRRLEYVANDEVIDISENRTVGDLEKVFRGKNFAICILRKSGRSWITTSLTKDWTLAQQNSEGEMMSSIHEAVPKNKIDWDGTDG